VYGGTEKFRSDPQWKDYILFYEYFHGDNGAGLGASHQTGWTGLVAKLIELFGRREAQPFLDTEIRRLCEGCIRGLESASGTLVCEFDFSSDKGQ
jgi:hypothetical protein